jgi:curved DNA-binding protein CbpA
MDDDAVFGWLELLDELDYYALLGVGRDGSRDDVHEAFRAFASTFHPDGHPGRTPREVSALDAIFKRGTEAFTVLTDAGLRERYDLALGRSPLVPQRVSLAPNASQAPAPVRLEDHARAPSARPFARRAEELFAAGDFKQAKLQMVMATFHDPGNDTLEAYLRDIQVRLRPKT